MVVQLRPCVVAMVLTRAGVDRAMLSVTHWRRAIVQEARHAAARPDPVLPQAGVPAGRGGGDARATRGAAAQHLRAERALARRDAELRRVRPGPGQLPGPAAPHPHEAAAEA